MAEGESKSSKKIVFAHYMGCFPLDRFNSKLDRVNHNEPGYENAIGGRYTNYPLLPHKIKLSEVEAAALDIRRAIRGGIDGFAVDAVAGREIGLHTFDVLFEAAEKYNLPFQITFCLDAPYRNPAAIKYIIDKHGNSSKLARRDGKILFFGYYSNRDAEWYAREYFDREKTGSWKVPEDFYKDTNFKGLPQLPRDTIDFPELKGMDDLLNTREGYAAHVKTFRHYEKQIGVPLHLQFEMSSILRAAYPRFRGADGYKQVKEVVEVLSEGFNSVGAFLPTTFLSDEQIVELSQIARKNNCEWGEALNYQYDNQMWERIHVGEVGLQIQKRWEMIEKTGSTMLQFTTWNDYAENTQLAPAQETKYTYLDLNAYFVKKWKEGKAPQVDEDRIYVIYPKYPKDAEANCFPFKVARVVNYDKPIEVITILKSPGVVRMPGRNVQWEAPAGFSYKQIAGTPGKVEVEIVRGKKVEKSLQCPEPISTIIFREQTTPTCFSTEFMKHWNADFGDTPPVLDGWYADKDNDGLPNWFEMYWFGLYGDFSTCTGANPGDDPDYDGFPNLQEYKNCTDPTKSDNVQYGEGYTWDLIRDVQIGGSFNPDLDSNRGKVWYYLASTGNEGEQMLPYELNARTRSDRDSEVTKINKFFPYNISKYPYGTDLRDQATPLSTVMHVWESDSTHSVLMNTAVNSGAAIAWQSPVTGTVNIKISCSAKNNDVNFEIFNQGKPDKIFSETVSKTGMIRKTLTGIRVQKGDRIFFHATRQNQPTELKITGLNVKIR
ncbi:MAG: endo-1,3-alpha-glucanase family glycosylhydrolase [Mangrovibacterium sp.]